MEVVEADWMGRFSSQEMTEGLSGVLGPGLIPADPAICVLTGLRTWSQVHGQPERRIALAHIQQGLYWSLRSAKRVVLQDIRATTHPGDADGVDVFGIDIRATGWAVWGQMRDVRTQLHHAVVARGHGEVYTMTLGVRPHAGDVLRRRFSGSRRPWRGADVACLVRWPQEELGGM